MSRDHLTASWIQKPNRTADDTEAEYDAIASHYDVDMPSWGWDTPAICAQMLKEHIGAIGPILDVGCGTGLSGENLREAGLDPIDGVDISRKSLTLAAEKKVYRELSRCDLLQPLPWPADHYEGVCCSGVLSNIPSIDFLKELQRIVRPGGVIACSHRDDLAELDGFEQRVDEISSAGGWVLVEARRSLPYLHGRNDYASADMRVSYYALRVTSG